MFKHAITRNPGINCTQGLTSSSLGVADVNLLHRQHEQYVDTLKRVGLNVLQLSALPEYPDAYFVEDVAVVTAEIAVITRPGASARRGEENSMMPVLEQHREVISIQSPGCLDGGDVLIIGKHCMVGVSARSNKEGATQLCNILADFGYMGTLIEVPDTLHFKSDVNMLDEQTLLLTNTFAQHPALGSYRKIVVPQDESYAANVVTINGKVLIADGFAKTQTILEDEGFDVIPMAVSEIEKMDGGLTCMSLRF